MERTMADETAEILDLERKRCAAIVARDWDTVSSMVADDVVHTHTTGISQTKTEYLAHAAKLNWVDVQRGDLLVRILGEAAVVTGPLINTIRGAGGDLMVIQAVATQVWRKSAGAWELCSFHATRLAPPA
jgi:ketosteroid isomerase-like protein